MTHADRRPARIFFPAGIFVLALAACSPAGTVQPRNEAAPDETVNADSPVADHQPDNVADAPAMATFASPDGTLQLSHPFALRPGKDFAGRSLMAGGWRLMWDGKDVGRGDGLARFALLARPTQGPGDVTEMLQIGMSRDPAVVASCLDHGLDSGSGGKAGTRMINGHRWTERRNADAGMSQSIDATDLRTVSAGACYAVDRVTYRTSAAETPDAATPTQAEAAATMDAILDSIRIGQTR